MAAALDTWGLAPDLAGVPAELRAIPKWVTWVAAQRQDGKVSKIPRQPRRPDQGASTNTRAHWSTFEEAVRAFREHGHSGIGFVLTRDDHDAQALFAIDLDHCVDPATGAVSNYAQAIVDELGSYTEISPSGTGLRIFGFGTLPGPAVLNHAAGVEIYDGQAPRYVTVTGRGSRPVRPVPAATLATLCERYGTPSAATTRDGASPPELPDAARCAALEADARAALGGEIRHFWAEGTLGERFPSRSELLQAAFTDLSIQDWAAADVYAAALHNRYVWQRYLDARQGNARRAEIALWADVQRASTFAAAHVTVARAEDFEDVSTAPNGGPRLAARLRRVADFGDDEPPVRQWIVDGHVPRREVTALSADGGTGKTLAAMQLQVAMGLGCEWFNLLPTVAGKSLGLYLEDDMAEVHRRFHAIATRQIAVPSELPDAHVLDREFEPDNLLMTFKDGIGRTTAFFRDLRALVLAERFDLVVLDPAANLFGGNENDRREVTQFITTLRVLAHEANCAVLLLVHPSRSGILAGTGDGGSTAWNNAVRSRLFLSRVKSEGIEPNPNLRTLTRTKSNYAAVGEVVQLAWAEGVFDALPSAVQLSADAADEALFLELLAEFDRSDLQVSASKQGHYAPRLFAKYCVETRRIERTTQAAMAGAMSRLLKAGRVEQVPNREGRSMCLTRARGVSE